MNLETYQFCIMAIMFILTATFSGAYLYRWRGGAPSIPRPFEQMLYCTMFLGMMLMAGVMPFMAGVCYVLAVIATLTGHGQYFLDVTWRANEPERLDFILVWLGLRNDPRTNSVWAEYRAYVNWYQSEPIKRDLFHSEIEPQIGKAIEDFGTAKLFRRCLAGMALTGGVVTLAPASALLFINIPVALVFFVLQTAAKPAAYYASHKAGFGTVGGEYGVGALQWFIAAITGVVLMVMA